MVLGFSTHAPSGGYSQPGYSHKEEYSKQDYYKDDLMHKEDYYKKDNYDNSSSMQMMRPHSGMHPSSGHNQHGNGSYPQTNGHGNGSYPQNGHGNGSYPQTNGHGNGSYPQMNGHGHGNSSNFSGMNSPNGLGRYVNSHGPYMIKPSRPQEMSYGHQSHGHNSSSPTYQQQHKSSHGWLSKDLDD